MGVTVNILEYNLPDTHLIKEPLSEGRQKILVWIPDFSCIILGRGSCLDGNVALNRVREDGIPIYRRPSGGETVLLSSRTLVISAASNRARFRGPRDCFDYFNGRIREILLSEGYPDIIQCGISDLAIADKKVLGSSIYQNRERIFYHGVLNVGESSLTIGRYLKHPPREPDYRQGRSHESFVTSLHSRGPRITIDELRYKFQTFLPGGP